MAPNTRLITPSTVDVFLETFYDSDYTSSFPDISNGTDESFQDIENNLMKINFINASVISIFGAVGNGVVIWLLGFRIKRNPFMTFILNLAVADFGVLLSAMVYSIARYFFDIYIDISFVHNLVIELSFFLLLLLYSASQSLLTAISIDRCVALFFPLWYRYKRSRHLSTIVCALIWVLTLSLTAVTYTIYSLNLREGEIVPFYQFIVNAVLCLPVLTVATVSLFIKVCLKSRQHQRGRLLTIIFLTLLFFLLFGFPLNVVAILIAQSYLPEEIEACGLLLASLNSSVNPVIYFLVGRQRMSRRRETLKMILQKAFKEEEGCVE